MTESGRGQEIDVFQPDDVRLKKNNFDLLRLLFAGTVCVVHAYELSGYQQLAWIGKNLSSAVAVKAFFVLSGFLIFMSYERSSSFSSYFKKRIRRIYPAYFTVIMLCAIGLFTISSKTYSDYFSATWIKYIGANLSFLNFLQATLPGVFEPNKLSAINGALWTLKIEVMFYLSVPPTVLLMRKFSRLPVLVLLYFSSIAYAYLFTALANKTGSIAYTEIGRQLPGQLSYFISGAFLYYFLSLFERRIGFFIIAAIIILVGNQFFPLTLLEPFALAVVVIFFGLYLYLGNFGKYGDFSYGIYILHFPIIQTFLYLGWFHVNPWYFLLTVISTTTLSAIALWHLVEKKLLFRSSHYLTAKTTTAMNIDSSTHVNTVR